ncbi:hypothetical protein LTR53_007556 [Teratosphaeriaceae sp. CCFEE 6253]|nr:hypothetical protein LTR53_007556 [Teratosphaeriaceae sp. CCFEE 6253]
MEAFPPSYESATAVDHWNIVARYVPSRDLCSAALVCSRWHTTFAPHLWGAPASHFNHENDRVYVALTKFKRTLQTARLLVRSLTHTLHLPPAHAEIYNGPHADWLRNVLERLPNLQTLVVRGLPFFDHSALQALKHVKPKQDEDWRPANIIELPASGGLSFQGVSHSPSLFGLRLLDASRCSNVTANGLSQVLSRFEALMYLDLSFTYPARDASVLAVLRKLSGLHVLKLRGISLPDSTLDTLAPAIGVRVRSLDIRDNRITDRGVRVLLERCFAVGNAATAGTRSPALLPYLGAEMLDIYQGEDFEGFIRSTFSAGFVSRLAIEDAPEGGITHLYISGNQVTAEGASGLVRSGRLHVLDLGSVSRGLARHPSVNGRNGQDTTVVMPGVEKLTSVLSKSASDSVTFIRIDHSIVTKDAPCMHPEEIIQGRVELGDTSLPDMPTNAVELDGTTIQHEVFELSAEHTPRYELPGDPTHFIISSAEADEPSGPRRGSAFAPEVVNALAAEQELATLLSPVSALGELTLDGTFSDLAPLSRTASLTGTPSSPSSGGRPRTYSSLAMERKARLNAHAIGSHNLHPAMLPHLSTLMLTDVPACTSDPEIIARLIAFIKHCSEEARLAKARAHLDYAIPPGRKGHASALKHSANKVFALKRLVLEMAPTGALGKASSKASPWQHSTTKSMTEDRDSEALWSAADTDFSFFGEGDECDFPSLERGRFAYGLSVNEKQVAWSEESPAPARTPDRAKSGEDGIDVVAALATFRRERKQAHERTIAAGATDPDTEGYWEGVVQVVRPGTGLHADEELDYYGNTYSGGYLYR